MTGELVAQLFKAYFMDLFVRIAQHTSSRVRCYVFSVRLHPLAASSKAVF